MVRQCQFANWMAREKRLESAPKSLNRLGGTNRKGCQSHNSDFGSKTNLNELTCKNYMPITLASWETHVVSLMDCGSR